MEHLPAGFLGLYNVPQEETPLLRGQASMNLSNEQIFDRTKTRYGLPEVSQEKPDPELEGRNKNAGGRRDRSEELDETESKREKEPRPPEQGAITESYEKQH
ncbi:unnamed protein product [Pleuronectes platessa]|uniref:Uncharacterized protein n=1 Tax=Pleuronectes platessa TaxID=8262 RepID=A0A9N7UQ95_PLEPL|nr:unnamed protein product [Pleuronectes platessa]